MAKFGAFILKFLKSLLLLVMAVVLFAGGVVTVVYSEWGQEQLRGAMVDYMNRRPGVHVRLDRFRLRFPARIEIDTLCIVQNGDSVIGADALRADVPMRPLTQGFVELREAEVRGFLMQVGTRDSATCIKLRAADARLAPAVIRLKDMNIHLKDGALSHGLVDLYINPNPPKSPKATTPPSPLSVVVDSLGLDSLRFRMSLLPTVDSLGVMIANGKIKGVNFDMLKQTIDVASVRGSGLNAAYIAPDAATIANTVVAPPDTAASEPWTVKVGEFYFDDTRALYTTRGVRPQPGLDFAYIAVDKGVIEVKDFYNRATTVVLPVSVSATERCGVTLSADGELKVQEEGLDFKDFLVRTANGTRLNANAFLGTGDLINDPTVPLRLSAGGRFAAADARLMFPAFRGYLAPMSRSAAIGLEADLSGTMKSLNITQLHLSVPGAMDVRAAGVLDDILSRKGPNGDVRFSGSLANVNPYLRMLMDPAGLHIPAMSLKGQLGFNNGNYNGDLAARTAAGDIALDGFLKGRGNVYKLDLDARNFPVGAFMPSLGVGNVTASVSLDGHGFDFMSRRTAISATVDLRELVYEGKRYSDLYAVVDLHDGKGHLELESGNPGLDLYLNADAEILPDNSCTIDATFNGRDVDLQALKLSPTRTLVSTSGNISASFDRKLVNVSGKLRLDDLSYITDADSLYIDDVTVRVNASDSLVNASVSNRDLYAFFSSPTPLSKIMERFTGVSKVIDNQMAEHRISVIEVQKQLPPFRLDVDAGDDNFLSQILAESKTSFQGMTLMASNDSVLNLTARALDVESGTTKLDTVTFNIHQHGERLNYDGAVNNRPGTFDDWAHVKLDGFFENNRLGVKMKQRNLQGQTGFDIGGNITLDGDSVAVLRLDPLNPVIAYKDWEVNEENFIQYSFTHKHLDADLHMKGAGSSLELFTEHAHEHEEAAHGADEDLVLRLSDIKIQDWIAINPFAPPMRGDLSADLRVNWENKTLTGNGNASLLNFYYGKERVGDLSADIDILTNRSGLMNADLALSVDGKKAVTLTGALNDSTRTSPFNLDLTMIHFPLSTANAFLPGVARLTGTLNGSMDLTGDGNRKPRLNGFLQFDSATVRVDMLGTKLNISDVKIPVENNVVSFNRFNVTACNENPLFVDGTVDIQKVTDPKIDLHLDADNMMLVDTRRAPKGAEVYGKAFVNLDADVKGDLDLMRVNANATILSGTNVFYIIPDGTTALQNNSAGDMVKFVNFTDSTAVAAADTIQPHSGTLLNLNAALTVQRGATLTVDLDSKGSNRVQLQSNGTLNYTMNPLNGGRMTGRLNIDGGFARYSMPPVLSEKLFNFKEGSYVAFNGDMMNPLLNIHAVDEVRSNVTSPGQNSRLIYFDVSLAVTGTLNNMDVAFDLATQDDATVANELATMSPQQRASAAMNLLLTNIYTGAGDTRGNANIGGNALYSFLTSQLNSWAANTIKGVDISFGVNQYDRTMEGSTDMVTQYSYRVSKSLFNDRFKIIVGGNYSTDNSNTNASIANNLLSDVSIEYMLNKSGSMYVRIFRHTGYESILEGEITQTGVGFVYRRKLSSLRSMFRFPRRKKKAEEQPVNFVPRTEAVGDSATVPADSLPVAGEPQEKPVAVKPEQK